MALLLRALSGTCAADGAAMQNAVFNSDFRYEQEYWTFFPAGLIRPRVDHVPIVDHVRAALVVDWGDVRKEFQMFSQRAIVVRPDIVYKVAFVLRGNGRIRLALNHYSPQGKSIGGSTLEAISLTDHFETHTYEFMPKPGVASVRPAIYFIPPAVAGDAASQDCVISEINFWVPESEFDGATREWPRDWRKMETREHVAAFFGEKFQDFKGFSDEDVREIHKAVRVDGVVPPYKPIQEIGKTDYRLTTAIWRFARGLLPSEIRVLDKASISQDMAVIVDTGSGRTTWHPVSALRAFVSEEKVVLSQEGLCGKLKVNMEGVLHYDGFMQVSIDAVPDGKIGIEHAELAMTFPSETATYIRFDTLTGGGFDIKGWRYGFGPIPAPGEEVNNLFRLDGGRARNEWTPSVYRDAPAKIWSWKEESLPYFWIGDEEKGLGWVAESDEGWQYTPGEDETLIIEREKDSVRARVVFIARPTELTASLKIRFALQHTPPKPVNPNWHRVQFAPGGPNVKRRGEPAKDPGTDRDYVTYLLYHHWSTGCSSPRVAKPHVLTACVNEAHELGMAVCPYLAPTHVAMNTPEGYYYGVLNKDWTRMPRVEHWPKDTRNERDVGAAVHKVCVNSFFSQWMVHGIGKMIDEYRIDGIYFDNCTIRPCTNTKHGCGYADAEGKIRPTVPFFAMRQFMMMVRNEFAKRKVEPHLWCHGAEYPGQVNFIDYSALGEGCITTDLTELLSLAECRANYIGPNQLGYIRMLLPQFNLTREYQATKKYDERWTRGLLALALPHGTRIWPAYCNDRLVFKANEIMGKLGTGPITFLPYWQWKVADMPSANRLLLTLYLGSDKAVLVAGNMATASQDATVPIAELKSIFPGYESVSDPVDGLPVVTQSGALTFEVKPKDFRLLLLE